MSDMHMQCDEDKKTRIWYSLLRCPDCRVGSLTHKDIDEVHCTGCGRRFPITHGRPVLLRHDNEIFRIDDYLNAPQPGMVSQNFRLSSLIPCPSVNLSRTRFLPQLGELIKAMEAPVVLVVGGGGQRSWLDSALGLDGMVRVVYTDIDIRADVDIFCDGHELPFQDCSYDAVITTAVLEHVLYPERVAGEILRVLKKGGLLYSELPFMQQVHEGAYDFTRYTLSGHRRLFNEIKEIESGMVAGPGTALVWAIENFLLGFVSRSFSRYLMKSVSRLLFSWLKYVDYYLANKPMAMDGASCTYLFGEKSCDRLPDTKIIASYIGANNLMHT
jgi:ubiquinone/menaquinone biosynthesis C-methylase UbiE/uncharacterized protein YbaR (Trm112 family)